MQTAEDDIGVEFRRAIRNEQRASRSAGRRLAEACRSGDLSEFYNAVDIIRYDGCAWPHAFRNIREPAHPDIAKAFLVVWIENKSIARNFSKLPDLTRGLRYIFRPYEGCPVKVYRGESARRHKNRNFGVSWTTDSAVAEKFATDMRQCLAGGSVIVETMAPAEAIIAELGDHYQEREYLVDPKKLGRVSLVKRFAQADQKQHHQEMCRQMA